ncbi:hypothetical protein NLI96_g11060 [Meripilus lineatus]|uniref:Uncharacterized protein n=1 Tax=Meripilus lineatus TaxID=2056292 RepID=A0AAD5UU27_9APHY|nr:hypothetical protein NLI96_g11060 [Physisporinus lineatus]
MPWDPATHFADEGETCGEESHPSPGPVLEPTGPIYYCTIPVETMAMTPTVPAYFIPQGYTETWLVSYPLPMLTLPNSGKQESAGGLSACSDAHPPNESPLGSASVSETEAVSRSRSQEMSEIQEKNWSPVESILPKVRDIEGAPTEEGHGVKRQNGESTFVSTLLWIRTMCTQERAGVRFATDLSDYEKIRPSAKFPGKSI